MKNSIILLCAVLLCAACGTSPEPEPPVDNSRLEIKIRPYLGGDTRAVNHSFENYINIFRYNAVTLWAGYGDGYAYDKEYVYDEATRSFSPETEPHYYPSNGESLPYLKVEWPENKLRELGQVRDQSELTEFLKADWLTSTRQQNVEPVEELSIRLDHEFALITFRITGANAGKKITSLTCAGYNAYCGDDSADACFIYDRDQQTLVNGVSGKLTLEGSSDPIIFIVNTVPDIAANLVNQNYIIEINL